ncbi:MAG: hypothetical protein ABFD96_01955 [Armatimonadia bacterium]
MRRLVVGLLMILACAAVGAQDCPAPLQLPPSPLFEARYVPLEGRVAGWIADTASPDRLTDIPPGRTAAEQAPALPRYEYPLDLVAQYRVQPDFSPGYLPEHFPGLNAGQMSGEDLLERWEERQGSTRNPFAIARDESLLLDSDEHEAPRRLALIGAYLWLHRGDDTVCEGAADALMSKTRHTTRDVALTEAGPYLLGLIPKTLTQVTAGDGEVSVDLRVTTEFADNSVATNEQALLAAAQRGLGAVAIASRGDIGDALRAQRTAERLKREGRLPANFRVIVGQYVDSHSGSVVGLFLNERLLDGQTLSATVEAIHKQGGLAYLARPGEIGAAAALERLPFDGYLIQTGNFELFRTLLLLNDPRFANKPALYASNTTIAMGVGLPYTNVPLQAGAEDPLKAGLAQRQGYAAGALYLPWMMVLSAKPVAVYQRTLNNYFRLNELVTLRLGRLLRADHVVLRVSWDDEMRNLISITKAVSAINHVVERDSPLLEFPSLSYIGAEYGRVGVAYDRTQREWTLSSRWRF